MGEEKSKLSFGFCLFVVIIEIIIAVAILGGAWLIDKFLLAPPLIVAFRLTRVKIESKYDIYHCATILACMFISTAICVFGLYMALPIQVSLVSNIIVGVGFSIITWHIKEIIDLKAKYTVKERLIEKCKDKGYNEFKTEIAIKFFINKEKPKDVWKWICENYPDSITWDSIYNLKSKMKKDLF